MANRAGLRKVVKTVRGKKGAVRRTYWVRAGDAVKSGARAAGGFIGRHKGAIAGALALAAMAGIAHHGNNVYKKAGGTGNGIYTDARASGYGRARAAATAVGVGSLFGGVSIGRNVHQSVRDAATRGVNIASMFHTSVMTARNSGFATRTQALMEGLRRARGATSQTRFGAGSAEPGRNG